MYEILYFKTFFNSCFILVLLKRCYFISSLYINKSRINDELTEHLKGIRISDYNQITVDIEEFSKQNKRIWISPSSSYFIYSSIKNKVRDKNNF